MEPDRSDPFLRGSARTSSAQSDYDKLRRRVLWTLPYGLYVLGSRAQIGGEVKRNLMTMNWATQLSFEPKLIGVGIERTALTHELVAEGRIFSLCTVDREDRGIVRKFTKPVEVDVDAMTLNGFAFHDGVTGAPILDQAPRSSIARCASRSSSAITPCSSVRSSTAASRKAKIPRCCAWKTRG